MLNRFLLALAALPVLASCAATADFDAPGNATGVAPAAASDSVAEPVWAFEQSDIAVDPGFVFGRLDNGMRYIIRQNATPAGQGLVRFHVETGAIDEREGEFGYAHFLEHMAFNGSTNVPEGEMVKLLERKGLAFGADTNAATGYNLTQYKLDLPNNSEDLLDTALMLMRETASELSFTAEAVDREKGVLLAEKRDRNNFAYRAGRDGLEFAYPDARITEREIAGTVEDLQAATPAKLRAFWEREYTAPASTLVVVGDFDPEMVEAKIKATFAGWRRPGPAAMSDFGPVDPARKGVTHVYIDPSLPESVEISRNGVFVDLLDTVAARRENTLRSVGYAIIARRLGKLARSEDPPFQGASFGTFDLFDAGRTTSLAVQTVDGQWQRGVDAVVAEYNRAMAFGFTEAEVAEQIAVRRNANETAAANEATRSNAELAGAAIALITDEIVPSRPSDSLARFNDFADSITPSAVLAAMKREVVELDDPLIRFTGKSAPAGGEQALRTAWSTAIARAPEPLEDEEVLAFPYTDFGTPGTIVADAETAAFGIRTIRFANGVMLNLKQTDLEDDQILVQYNLDGGSLLDTKANPTATTLVNLLPQGGLGQLSIDQLISVLAGRSVGLSFGAGSDTFSSYVATKPRDLELQLQLMAALLTDPGYRSEAITRFRQGLDNFFAQQYATPGAAYGAEIGGILSDDDPRFVVQPQEVYAGLDFDKLRADIGDRLAKGAIEIGVVGDFDEQAVIDAVAATFGALPQRETAFRDYSENRQRSFTADRGVKTIYHDGEPDQAQIRYVWPTTDDRDQRRDVGLTLLARVADIALTENLRERLGQAYSPFAGSETSRIYPGYGTFSTGVLVDVAQLSVAQAAVDETVAELTAAPISGDLLQRARQPLLESFDNALKTNGGWMSLVEDAQRNPEWIQRFQARKALAEAVTGAELQALARQYLAADAAVKVLVLPRPAQ